MKKIITIILKILIVVGAIIGIILNTLTPYGQFLGAKTTFLFFTIQSNIWIALTMLLLLIIHILEVKTKKEIFKKWMYVLKLVFTVSITLTCMVYCFILVPSAPKDFNCWDIGSILLHAVVPVLAIIDYFVDIKGFQFKTKEVFFVILPPLYYLFFSLIGYILNWNFGEGHNYPYFFLNYNSPAGVFGFSNEAPYYMGSFYWIIILLFLVLGIGFVYKIISNKLNKK